MDIMVRVVLSVRASNYSLGGSTPSSNLYCSKSPDLLQPLLVIIIITNTDIMNGRSQATYQRTVIFSKRR